LAGVGKSKRSRFGIHRVGFTDRSVPKHRVNYLIPAHNCAIRMSDGRQAPWAFDQSGKQSCLVNTEFARMLAEKML